MFKIITKIVDCGTKKRLIGMLAAFVVVMSIGAYIIPGAGLHDFALDEGEAAPAFLEIPENEVPLSAVSQVMPPSANYSGTEWALLNLILTVVTGAIMLATLTLFSRDRAGGAKGAGVFGNRRFWLGAVTVAVTAASVLTLLMTQNLTLPMVTMDEWTVLHAVMAVAAILAVDYDRMLSEEEEVEALSLKRA